MKRSLMLAPLVLLAGCFPDLDSPKVQQQVADMRRRMAVDQFDRAIAQIELYKLRHGTYPDTWDAGDTLERLLPHDRAALSYAKVDSGYALDLMPDKVLPIGLHADSLSITFPAAYWEGLGCRRSNLMPVR